MSKSGRDLRYKIVPCPANHVESHGANGRRAGKLNRSLSTGGLNKAGSSGGAPALQRSSTGEDVTVNDVDISGQNSMLRAAARGDSEEFGSVYNLCSRNKSDVNFTDYSERTALMHASIAGCHSIVKRLLGNKIVAIDCQDKSGFTALMHAAQRGHEAIAEMLLQKKANYKLTDTRGNTAIVLAARRNHVACLEVLAGFIKDPADWKVKAEHGLTAFQWAETNQRQEAAGFVRRTLSELAYRKAQTSSESSNSNRDDKGDGEGGPEGPSREGDKDADKSSSPGSNGRKRPNQSNSRTNQASRHVSGKKSCTIACRTDSGGRTGGYGSGDRDGGGGGGGGGGGDFFANRGVRNYATPNNNESYAVGDIRSAYLAYSNRVDGPIPYGMGANQAIQNSLRGFLESKGFHVTDLNPDMQSELMDYIQEHITLDQNSSVWALALIDFGHLTHVEKLQLLELPGALAGVPKLLLNHGVSPAIGDYGAGHDLRDKLFVYSHQGGDCAGSRFWEDLRNHFDHPPPWPEFTRDLHELVVRKQNRIPRLSRDETAVFDNFLENKLFFPGN